MTPENLTNEWTMGTLSILVNQRFDDQLELTNQRFTDQQKAVETALTAQEKAVTAALQAAKEAVLKAEGATDKRFESVNEFRAQLTDQSNTFITRREFQAGHEGVLEKVSDLTDRINKSEGVTTGSGLTMGKIYGAIGALGVLLGILLVILNLLGGRV